MNHFKPIFVCLIVIAVFYLFACKKDNKVVLLTSPEDSVSRMLQAHSWKYNQVFYLKKSGLFFPYNLPSCFLDDKLDYLNNNLYLKDLGMNLCSGQINKKDTLNWQLTNNSKQLEIINNGTKVKKDILRIAMDSLFTSEVTINGDTEVFLYLKY